MIEGQTLEKAVALAAKGLCPCCDGTGDEDGTGDACGGSGCVYCTGEGCGGSCSWCGGSGKLSGWRHGNPSYRGVLPDHLVDQIEAATPALF